MQHAARVYLIHERREGDQHPQVDINRSQQAALQLIFSKLHSVHIVEFHYQTVDGYFVHYLVLLTNYKLICKHLLAVFQQAVNGEEEEKSLPFRFQNKTNLLIINTWTGNKIPRECVCEKIQTQLITLKIGLG